VPSCHLEVRVRLFDLAKTATWDGIAAGSSQRFIYGSNIVKLIPCQPNSDEWRQARCGPVTASRIADVMAKGKKGAESAGRKNHRGELACEISDRETLRGRLLLSGCNGEVKLRLRPEASTRGL
jgi:hypothetical protein